MLSPLAQRLLPHIRKRDLMRAGDRVAIAVSGGADSVALLRLMLEVRDELGVVLSVAHFNHKIRGDASDADEAFVRELARQYSLGFHCNEADVPAHARERKISLESAARELRYEFFASLMMDDRACTVATAHTLDDQAETVLMRIIRGTGVSGLTGIHPRKIISWNGGEESGDVVRPLLDIRRTDLEAYLRSSDQRWREDATNADLHHTRNRIRQLIVPLLEREFTPAIRERLAELSEIAREEEEFWRVHQFELTERVISEENLWLHHLVTRPEQPHAPGVTQHFVEGQPPCPAVWLRISPLMALSVAEQRRTIRNATIAIGLAFADIERIRALAAGEIQGLVQLPGGCAAWCERGVLKFGRQQQDAGDTNAEHGVTCPLDGPSQFRLGNCLIRLSPTGAPGKAGALDCNKLPAPELILRPWRPGDRFWPQHSSGPKKVKELLTDKHITGAERQLWPVIACGDDVVWLRGFGVSQPYAAHGGTTEVIAITEEPFRF